ncbi:hypothetical protein GYMLUDRAFT_45638 [Collybiopsis luxurians FD-317 M1]|uniref:Uncharacterized protein n=1 Tax=Collybiopsis luxurians FD-317 M1 TaxID=944289 RepID=A0A0D0CIG5_9AGAR|nr:hypothetical protein GYMLUDRAFT_45638 [Collybiopsis luxurians FD-317 M1]
MRFTFTSVLFVVFSVLFTIFTAEAAAISRPQKFARAVDVPVLDRAIEAHQPVAGKRTHSRDFRAVPRVVEERSEVPPSLNRRLHARDFRAVH